MQLTSGRPKSAYLGQIAHFICEAYPAWFMSTPTSKMAVAGATVHSLSTFQLARATVPASTTLPSNGARAEIIPLRPRVKNVATAATKRAALTEVDATPPSAARGLPRPKTSAPRVTARLCEEEREALTAFANERCWTPTTALRAILREKLLGETLPL